MWWLYFSEQAHERLRGRREAFVWGYGHLVIFAAAAAVGAGLAVVADHAAGTAHIGRTAAGAAVVVPVSLYLLALWLVHLRHNRATGWRRYACPVPGGRAAGRDRAAGRHRDRRRRAGGAGGGRVADANRRSIGASDRAGRSRPCGTPPRCLRPEGRSAPGPRSRSGRR